MLYIISHLTCMVLFYVKIWAFTLKFAHKHDNDPGAIVCKEGNIL